nr:hypothetical protein CFP56_67328 [Quercus suber]
MSTRRRTGFDCVETNSNRYGPQVSKCWTLLSTDRLVASLQPDQASTRFEAHTPPCTPHISIMKQELGTELDGLQSPRADCNNVRADGCFLHDHTMHKCTLNGIDIN